MRDQFNLHRRMARCATLMLFVVLGACTARQPGDPIEPGFNVYSPADDIEIGRQSADEIQSQVEVVDDPSLQAYVARLGSVLSDHPSAGPYPYSFTLINDPAINAFALPGGPIFIHSGLIQAARNEAQLAGVIAHEIAHVALRHGTSQASKSSLIQLPAVLAGAAIGQDSVAANLGQLGLGLGLNSLLLRYSRSAETESDALGARLMASAGYDPVQMAMFFEILEGQQSSRPPEFLSSHPNPGNRVAAVRAELATFPDRPQYTASTGQFASVQSDVARLPEPPQVPAVQQAVLPAEAPSGRMLELRHSAFRIAYPAEWRAYGDAESPAVTIAPDNGLVRARSGRVSLGYGAVVGFGPSSGSLLRDTDALIGELRSANPAMEVIAPGRSIQVDGASGLVTELRANSPFGGSERDLLVTIRSPQGLMYVVFVAPERAFGQISPVFESMYESITF